MKDAFSDILHIVKKPSVTEAVVNVLVCAVPIWLAVVVGLLIGWSWRPRWTSLVFLGLRSRFRFLWTVPPGFGARRLWFAFTALSIFSVCRTLWCSFKGRNGGKLDVPLVRASPVKLAVEGADSSRCSWHNEAEQGEEDIVTEKDLEQLLHFLDETDALIEWQCMMERSTSNMAYQAWLHEPPTGPTVYRSRTIFEDASPELVRDFFWDDQFRPQWDPMLVYFKTLSESPLTGTMIVHWIKKFPFFCSDREYVVGRRIWEMRKTYYCVTKAVQFPGLVEREKPKRVDDFFSSWIIKRVESRRGDGLKTACEVSLVHYEDMMIPRDVAKLGVRHGMWGAVKKVHSGMRVYQNARSRADPLSRCAIMAKITTRISLQEEAIESSSSEPVVEEEDREAVDSRRQAKELYTATNWRWVIIGGSMAVICGFHSASVAKALFVGLGQKILHSSHRQT